MNRKNCKWCDKIKLFSEIPTPFRYKNKKRKYLAKCFMFEDHQFEKIPDCSYCDQSLWLCIKCGIESNGIIGGFYQR